MKYQLEKDIEEKEQSLPPRGAWIEIVDIHIYIAIIINVAPPTGSVD